MHILAVLASHSGLPYMTRLACWQQRSPGVLAIRPIWLQTDTDIILCKHAYMRLLEIGTHSFSITNEVGKIESLIMKPPQTHMPLLSNEKRSH